MSYDDDGLWIVLETGQGGHLPDCIHGPYWSRGEAQHVAQQHRDYSRVNGRRDRFRVAHADPLREDDE